MAKLTFKLTRDTLFKILFVKHEDLLKNLVSQILCIDIDTITEFHIENPNIEPEALGQKFCHLDIKMKVNGQVVNLEVQVKDEDDYPERSLYHWARCYSSALATGKDYIDLPRTVAINIVEFELFKDTKDFHSEFRALEVTRHTELTDRMSMHYFELKKLPKVAESDAENGLKLWLSLFNAETDEELSKIEKIGGKTMVQAIQAYKSVVVSDEFKEAEIQRQIAEHNEAAALRHERTKTQKEFVLNMHEAGFSNADIVKASKLTEAEVNNILDSNNIKS